MEEVSGPRRLRARNVGPSPILPRGARGHLALDSISLDTSRLPTLEKAPGGPSPDESGLGGSEEPALSIVEWVSPRP